MTEVLQLAPVGVVLLLLVPLAWRQGRAFEAAEREHEASCEANRLLSEQIGRTVRSQGR